MRLIDLIAQQPMIQLHLDETGKRHVLEAPHSVTARARGSALRYIIEDEAARRYSAEI